MNEIDTKAREIFMRALDVGGESQINEFIALECGSDERLLERVRVLFQAHDNAGNFLDNGTITKGHLDTESDLIGQTVGSYKLLQTIGEGGMGRVYMAEQLEPVKRRVALKIIKPGMDTRQVIARFEAERQALSMMDHPNIANVLDVGTNDAGRPYFVMELVKGIPITQYCDEKRIGLQERLKLFKSVCNAVQHAHQKGIIHRDIKPSNILVAEYDNQPVPKIIDFGLAKALSQQLTEKTLFTQLGQVVGTFEYMSPEQSKMNQLDVDTRTDIYSLGVLLYELLTGTTPFDKKRFREAALDEVIRIIREEEPPKPSTRASTIESRPQLAANRRTDPDNLSSSIKGDLDWIVMKAMDKERSHRYETVNGMSADVQRHLDGEPIVAAPPSWRYRAKKFVRRNRFAVTAASFVSVALFLGMVGTSIGLAWALIEKERADTAATRALQSETAERQAKEMVQLEKEAGEYSKTVSNINSGSAFLQNNSISLAQNILKQVPPRFRNWEWAFLVNQAWKQYSTIDVKREPDRVSIATTAEKWAHGKWQIIREIIPPGNQSGLSDGRFSADGTEVYITTANGSVGRYSLTNRTDPVFFRPDEEILWYVAPSPDGERLLGEGISGRAFIWDVDDLTKPILQSPPEIDLFTSYRYHWSPDQQYLVSIHNDQSLRLWNSQTLNQIGVVNNLTDSASAAESVGIYEQFSDVHFDPSGNFILTTALDGAVRKWKLPFDGTGSELISQVPVAGGIQLQEISPKAKYVATSYGDGSKILWEIESGQIVKELVQPYSDSLTGFRGLSMNFSRDGSCLALTSGNNDKTLTLKSIPDGNTIADLTGHASAIRSAIFSPDGGMILTVSEDGTAKVWAPQSVDPRTTRQLANAHDDIVFQIDLDASGKILLTGSYDGTARIWDLGRKQLIATHEGHDSEIVAVDLTPDGKKAATLDATGTLNIWDSNSGQGFSIDPDSNEFAKQISRAGSGVRREVLSFPAPLSTGLFSPDGSCVVLFHKNSMKVFDAHDGSLKTTLQGASSCGWAVFNHSSTMVCILEMNAKKAGVWDLKTGRLITRLINRRGALAMIQFSPIEDRLITGDMAGRTCIWDPRDGSTPIETLKRPSSFMTTSRFSPCGKYILAADGSSVAIYDASKPYELLSTLEGHTARISDIRISPDGSRIFTWSGNAKSILWDFKPERESKKANPLMSMNSKKRLQQALWTPDGRNLITSWSDGHIEIWNGATRADLQQLDTSENFESDFDSWRRRFMNSGD